MAKAGIQFSKKDEWYTPKEVVDHFGPFDYDPATTSTQSLYLGIPNFDTIKTNGLKTDWTKYKRIWINPPFTRKFEFLKKAVETVRNNKATKIFFLLPIETLTTKNFHKIVSGGGILCGCLAAGSSSITVLEELRRQRLGLSYLNLEREERG